MMCICPSRCPLREKCRKSDQEIYDVLSREMRQVNPKYHIDIMVDRNFISGKRYGLGVQ